MAVWDEALPSVEMLMAMAAVCPSDEELGNYSDDEDELHHMAVFGTKPKWGSVAQDRE